MMSNTATFILNIHSFPFHIRRQDEMGVESVSVVVALSHSDIIEISCHYPTRVLLLALESMESKTHTSYRIYSTNDYIQNH